MEFIWLKNEQENPELFAKLLNCRYLVLRKPLNMPLGSERNKLDGIHSYHLMCVDKSLVGEPVTGCVSLHTIDHVRIPNSGKLYQMAVLPNLQRNGLGRELVSRLLEYAQTQLNISLVYCHARHYAIPFYLKCGMRYTPDIPAFEEVGMEHRCMDISLPLQAPHH